VWLDLEGRRGAIVIGRDPGCDLVVPDASVSRKHATLHVSAFVLIEAHESRNGTRVAGKVLKPGDRTALANGVAAELGDALATVLEGGDGGELDESSTESAQPLAPSSPAMDRVNRLVLLVAKSAISVIIRGETGVGKEVLAERIHAGSARRSGPFVAVNCAAISEQLLESELFGYEKGAFTGATAPKVGLLESANRGTVFLDELGEMPLSVQVKLLRVLEKREVVPVGGVRPRPIDVRIVSATHRDLEQLVAKQEFRADLYFRLNGISIEIPPLRDRRPEIAGIASQLASAAGATLEPDVIDALVAHDWPGNIRELKNTVDRAVALADGGTITRECLMFDSGKLSAAPPGAAPAGDASDERQKIVDALAQTNGNQTRAAELLGITRRVLSYRMETYKISGPQKRR
jgi:transcriptional regulator with PAS, ATPase and Fis domain